MLNIPALEKLVHELSRLPGVGPKTAQRLAYHILQSRDEYTDRLSDALHRVRAEVHTCPRCFNYTDHDLCRYCEDTNRSDELLCVVEEPSDIMRIESSGVFRGRYHVLHGAISPLEGVGPDDLRISELIERVEKGRHGEGPAVKEIILALDADLEGDTTILYLTKQLAGKGVKICRIAHGVPIGSDIDFIDDRTMGRALENRVEL
ncbi:MAG: recombination mediator RecR [Bdellovibrionaceae bacterium]|nr:recombination mediator RecR [Pseudobdellovibrionaceae bacterium]MBX3033810.1 recombination mediator RecR [Pseudobdellovibrionaceae bacterium]